MPVAFCFPANQISHACENFPWIVLNFLENKLFNFQPFFFFLFALLIIFHQNSCVCYHPKNQIPLKISLSSGRKACSKMLTFLALPHKPEGMCPTTPPHVEKVLLLFLVVLMWQSCLSVSSPGYCSEAEPGSVLFFHLILEQVLFRLRLREELSEEHGLMDMSSDDCSYVCV